MSFHAYWYVRLGTAVHLTQHLPPQFLLRFSSVVSYLAQSLFLYFKSVAYSFISSCLPYAVRSLTQERVRMRLSILIGSGISLANSAIVTVTRTHAAICPTTSSAPPWMSSVFTNPASYSATASSTAPSTSPSSSPADTALNAGSPFLITITPVAPAKARRNPAVPLYIQIDGYLTSNASLAATFSIQDGQLLANTWLESTDTYTSSAIFAASPSDSVGPITRTFMVSGGAVHWYSSSFTGGEAVFYYAAAGSMGKRQATGDAVMILFQGAPNPGWTAVRLGGQSEFFTLFINRMIC